MQRQTYAIGRFMLEPHRQLRDGARPVDLGGKALDILSVLATANGSLVTKDELMEAVWPGVVVEENAIQVHVSAARRALGEEAGRLVTVWGRGYRLKAAPIDSAEAAGGTSPLPPSSDPEAARLVAQARALAQRVTPEALLRAIDLHERAITRDPGFAAAWTGLAGTLMIAMQAGVLPPERRGSARAMAEQAIRIDRNSGAPYAIRAVLDAGECRWVEAEAGLRAAAERSPDDPQVREAAVVLWAPIGHVERATSLVEYAARAAPASANMALSRAHITMISGDMATMAAQLETAALLGAAEDGVTMRVLRTELALGTGDCAAAAVQMAALLGSVLSLPAGTDEATAISAALIGYGDSAAASSALMRIVEASDADDALQRTQILLGRLINWQVRLGALDAAFALAARLIRQRERSGYLAVRAIQQWWRADMAAFRRDCRFAELARQVAFPAAWEQFGWPDSYRPDEA